MELVTLYIRVEFDDNIEDVLYRLAVVVKSAQRQFVIFSVTQSAPLSLLVYLLIGKMSVVAERIN